MASRKAANHIKATILMCHHSLYAADQCMHEVYQELSETRENVLFNNPFVALNKLLYFHFFSNHFFCTVKQRSSKLPEPDLPDGHGSPLNFSWVSVLMYRGPCS